MIHSKKILISEDDVYISEQLKYILLDLGYRVTDIVSDIQTAKRSLKTNVPNLAILDIKMHGTNQGFEIAKFINDEINIPFIFLTSFSDTSTVQEANIFSPNAYLLKPFNENDIYTTLETVFNNLQKNNDFIIINDGVQKVKVLVADILWLKSDDKYIELITNKKKYILRESISGFLEKYHIKSIIRTHRSYAVNASHIDSLTNAYVTIKSVEIPMSRKYMNDITNFFD